jgi:lipoprotein-releasing system ATP-binding protein
MLPGLIAGRSFLDVKEKAYKLLKELLLEKIINHRPTMISFGEAQRVAIARALINSPKLILADEPTGSLDWETQREVKKVLWDKVRENNCAMIFVTHDINLAKGANRVLRLINGRTEALEEE